MNLIDKWVAMQAVQGIDSVATLRDGDPVIRMSAVEHVLENLPEVPDINVGNIDAISRRQAIRWVKQECNPYGKPTLDFESGKRVMEHLELMPSAQPYTTTHDSIPAKTGKNDDDRTSGDCISRQAAIDICNAAIDLWHGQIGEGALVAVRDKIAELTPAEPKKGRWIEISSINHTYKCSECGRLLVNVADGRNNVSKHYPYCHCGADMRGDKHETD